MGLTKLLRAVAAGGPAQVFAVSGRGERAAIEDLRLAPDVRLVPSPRAANVFVVAGEIDGDLIDAVVAIHDQVPEPRCTIVWAPGRSFEHIKQAIPRATFADSNLAATVVREHKALQLGTRGSEPPLLPDVDPAPWRGVGPYGQGGTGMTGGVPYGRPLAERAPDRDGLSLDRIPLRLGPFFSPLPDGLILDVELQGDVVQSLEVGGRTGVASPDEPFASALTVDLPVAELEIARARSHLRWMSEGLVTYGLEALARRVLVWARTISERGAGEAGTLEKSLRRAGVFGYATAGVGTLDPDALAGLGLGPNGRAAGLAEDERAADPAYRALGFEVIVHDGGDARARWLQRWAEVKQSLELAAKAGARRAQVTGRVESARGRLDESSTPTGRLSELLPSLITGQEWGDAMATLVSLDISPEEMSAPRSRVGAAG